METASLLETLTVTIQTTLPLYRGTTFTATVSWTYVTDALKNDFYSYSLGDLYHATKE
jgi:hypothetical protein